MAIKALGESLLSSAKKKAKRGQRLGQLAGLAMIGNLDTVEYAKIQSDASSKSCKPKDISFLFGENEYSKDELSETHEDVQTLCTTYEKSDNYSSGKVACESATIGIYGGMKHGDKLINKDKSVCNW